MRTLSLADIDVHHIIERCDHRWTETDDALIPRVTAAPNVQDDSRDIGDDLLLHA